MKQPASIVLVTMFAVLTVLAGCASRQAVVKTPESEPALPSGPKSSTEKPAADGSSESRPRPAPAEEALNLYNLPPASSKQCADYVESIVRRPEPLLEACISRYKSLTEEAILCRLDIVQFLRQNSLGEGEGFSTCGKPPPAKNT